MYRRCAAVAAARSGVHTQLHHVTTLRQEGFLIANSESVLRVWVSRPHSRHRWSRMCGYRPLGVAQVRPDMGDVILTASVSTVQAAAAINVGGGACASALARESGYGTTDGAVARAFALLSHAAVHGRSAIWHGRTLHHSLQLELGTTGAF